MEPVSPPQRCAVLGRNRRLRPKRTSARPVPPHPQACPAMSLVALPFYQKRHKHFDQSYRNTQTRYLLREYAARK